MVNIGIEALVVLAMPATVQQGESHAKVDAHRLHQLRKNSKRNGRMKFYNTGKNSSIPQGHRPHRQQKRIMLGGVISSLPSLIK